MKKPKHNKFYSNLGVYSINDPLLKLSWLIHRGYDNWPPMMPKECFQTGLWGGKTREEILNLRESWDKDQWEKYAHFLEEKGEELNLKLFRTEMVLTEANRLKSRKRAVSQSIQNTSKRGLLGWKPPVKRRRGAPKKNNWAKPREAIEIQDEIKRKKGKCSATEALGEWYARNGMRRSRANTDRSTINQMSKLRTTPKNHK